MDRYRQILETLSAEGRLRSIPKGDPTGIDLSQNDYLGLGTCNSGCTLHYEAMTSSASRLLASNQSPYYQLEEKLEQLYEKPALLFNSGYHANVGTIQALAVDGTLIVSDKLIHASAIDGIRLSKAPCLRFRHNDVDQLEKILNTHNHEYERMIVVVESIYSMDGDIAPLQEIKALKERFPKTILYVDEAHGVGVRGINGLGVCSEMGILESVDILVGTCGKALASAGAFVVTTPLLKDYLINTARSFIFSTALPAANHAHTLAMIEKMVGMNNERKHLMDLSMRLHEGLEKITGISNPSQSQIIPWIIGDANRAVYLSQRLKEAGFNALPIRRPTVPAGTERIRFSLNANLSIEDIDRLLETIKRISSETP